MERAKKEISEKVKRACVLVCVYREHRVYSPMITEEGLGGVGKGTE